MTSFFSSAPVHQVTEEAFLEIERGEGDSVEHRFTRQVHWLMECQANHLFVHGGRVLTRGDEEFSERSGFLSSVREALDEAPFKVDEFSISAESTLDLIVRVEIKSKPALLLSQVSPGHLNKDHRLEYMPIPDSWLQEDGVFDEIPQYTRLSQIKRVLLMNNIWSTKNSSEQNAELEREFFERWTVKEVV